MKRTARAIADTLGSARKLGLLLLALAFALQAYTVQTHVHAQLVMPAVMMITADGSGHPPVDPIDPHTCKMCREVVMAVAVMPAAPTLLAMLDWVATAIPVSQLPATQIAPETGWQSRAPPTH
jgi:hypothetical protein